MKRIIVLVTAICFAFSMLSIVACAKKEEPTPTPPIVQAPIVHHHTEAATPVATPTPAPTPPPAKPVLHGTVKPKAPEHKPKLKKHPH
jgi:hypothetical protein